MILESGYNELSSLIESTKDQIAAKKYYISELGPEDDSVSQSIYQNHVVPLEHQLDGTIHLMESTNQKVRDYFGVSGFTVLPMKLSSLFCALNKFQ